MAKKINEVWYAYNAKGQKIPPYKSTYTDRGPKTLIGKMWKVYKQNWIELTVTFIVGILILSALMYGFLQLIS
tara:strand:+ start:1806 stop:2024 length:219 start_codon:yes stop_codon:yes gene_type:complete